MSDCAVLSDRMPDVALGQSAWTLEEARHLEHCASCKAEWSLVQVSSRIGRNFEPSDPAITAQAVLHRMDRHHEELRSRRSRWGFAALASAAAAAALIWAGWTARAPVAPRPVPVVATLQMQLPELDDLLPAELNAVLQTMDEPYIGGAPDDEDLDNGFATLEG
jgi:hypothetical protein